MTKIIFNLKTSLDYYDDLETMYHIIFKESNKSRLSYSREIFDVGEEKAIITLYTDADIATVKEFCSSLYKTFSERWQSVEWNLE